MGGASGQSPPRPAPPNTDAGSVLSTLNDDGTRRWIKPRLSPGRWWSRRRGVAWLLIAIFTLIPHLRMNGKPLILLDLATRRFTFFGHTFLPTDTILLALLLMGVFFTVFLCTALFGRVWCGWACPQTVYLEFVYRPIERLFEGGPGRRHIAWLHATGLGRVLKHLTYILVSCFLAHTFLAYFVGTDTLRQWVVQSPFRHPGPFLVMAVTTSLMLFDFTYFREQTCIVACPYGRMQSTLLDRRSLIVTYDPNRGEPRRGAGVIALGQLKQGDCVDCGLCVATCPTGIDIRNGLQMECVHCTQCMDACDAVMAKIKKPLGLIRYGSQAELAGEKAGLLRPRTLIYPTLIALIVTAIVIVITRQGPASVRVLRGRGPVYTTLPDGAIANPILIKIANRRDAQATFTLDAAGAQVRSDAFPATLKPGEVATLPATLMARRDDFTQGRLDVRLIILGENGLTIEEPHRMGGPAAHPRQEPKP